MSVVVISVAPGAGATAAYALAVPGGLTDGLSRQPGDAL